MRIISAGTDSQSGDIRATGLVGSQEEARLGFKTGGLISSIRVEAGGSVRQGQVLASLDTTELDAQVRQADENLA
ncbi:biotin/lipoyl-binding protein, partial [Acinetobacter baumannii]